MKIINALLICLMCTSCTLNINLTDTHGFASDVVDETTSEKVDPEVSLPLTGV